MCNCVYALEFNHVLNNCHATIGCLRPEFPSRGRAGGALARSLALPLLSVRTCDEQGGPLARPPSSPSRLLPTCPYVCPSDRRMSAAAAFNCDDQSSQEVPTPW